MISKDVKNCYDTLKRNVTITGANAGIKTITKKLVCTDILQLFDSSKIQISTKLDSITKYFWDFGDGKTPSYLKNPFHYYSSFGNFTITHAITSLIGCIDTFRTQISIEGPLPNFSIKDTIGCAPFKAEFDNHSQKCSQYIWHFGDPLQNTHSTRVDTSVSFTYLTPGIYDVYLIGSDSVVNPDNQNQVYYCSAVFPDTSAANAPMRRVVVLPHPKAAIDMPDFWCRDQPLKLKSLSDSVYDVFHWNVNGTAITSYQSDTSIDFSTTEKKIIVTLAPTYSQLGNFDAVCFDSASREIDVSGVLADFTYKLDSICNGLSLTNTSEGATNFLWTYSIASNPIGTDKVENPTKEL
jgi:PKD repeat protein